MAPSPSKRLHYESLTQSDSDWLQEQMPSSLLSTSQWHHGSRASSPKSDSSACTESCLTVDVYVPYTYPWPSTGAILPSMAW
jgi:hypothetical protein